MKKLLVILLALTMVLAFAACGTPDQPVTPDTPDTPDDGEVVDDTPAVEGKIAIVTNTVSQNEEEYRSAESMVAKYGDRIIHELLPDNFMTEQEQLISVIS